LGHKEFESLLITDCTRAVKSVRDKKKNQDKRRGWAPTRELCKSVIYEVGVEDERGRWLLLPGGPGTVTLYRPGYI
jgi:hypothetical protein